MANKVTLTYENGEFNVAINENVVYSDKDMENSILKFNAVIKNNAIDQSTSWDFIENDIKSYKIDDIELNSQFKTITFEKMKYFYNTDKVFYLENDNMVSLGGGYSLFNFVLDKISKGELSNEVSFLELCKISMINNAVFRVDEDVVRIASPMFSYGSVEYNFTNKKIDKGTRIEKGSFEEFKSYVLNIFK